MTKEEMDKFENEPGSYEDPTLKMSPEARKNYELDKAKDQEIVNRLRGKHK